MNEEIKPEITIKFGYTTNHDIYEGSFSEIFPQYVEFVEVTEKLPYIYKDGMLKYFTHSYKIYSGEHFKLFGKMIYNNSNNSFWAYISSNDLLCATREEFESTIKSIKENFDNIYGDVATKSLKRK